MSRWLRRFCIVFLVVLSASGFSHRAVQAAPAAPFAIVHKTGVLKTDETWVSSDLYVIDGDLTVPAGVTLTLQAGVIVKLAGVGSYAHDGSVFVGGKLLALGTADNGVLFTSLYDDSAGGDTNGDGGASTPAAGDWARIEFSGSSVDSRLEYTTLRYGGRDRFNYLDGYGWHETAYAALNLLGASPSIANSTIRNNWSSAIGCAQDSSPVISNNTLSANGGYGVYLDGPAHPTISHNTISSNKGWAFSATPTVLPALDGNTLSGNSGNGLEIRGGTIDADTTWPAIGVPYGVTGQVRVGAGVTLKIEPGTILKFWQSGLAVDGQLEAHGAFAQRVCFTSLRDDSLGGDTNGDGTATSPACGNWNGLEFTGSSQGSSTEFMVLRYANKAVYAIGASLLITSTTLTNNNYGIWSIQGGQPAIHASRITGNCTFGVRNDDAFVTVDAGNNWWGDAKGPSTPSGPNPKADKISDYVAYYPWLSGSPLAPVLKALSASRILNSDPTTVEVTGANFLKTPVVRLNSIAVAGVVWHDETRISLVIPAGFPPGVYALTIANQDGETIVIPAALQIVQERRTYLPMLVRQPAAPAS